MGGGGSNISAVYEDERTKEVEQILCGLDVDVLPGGGSYQGQYLVLEDGRRVFHDRGRHIYPDGAMYVGEFRCGQKTGYGRYIFPVGHVFFGHFEADLRCGDGICQYANGDTYTGQWFLDRRHGYGEYKWSSPERMTYKGLWEHDKPIQPVTPKSTIGVKRTCIATDYDNDNDNRDNDQTSKRTQHGDEFYSI
jgi:hypothetical protein